MANTSNDFNEVVMKAFKYKQLFDDKVTGPDITLDLDDDLFVVKKKEE